MLQSSKKGISKALLLLPALIVALSLLYGIALIAGALIPVGKNPSSTENDSSLYLINNGLHVELALPADQAPERLLRLLNQDDTPVLYCFGWGDRYFYPGTPTVSELALGPTLKALFLPTPAAIGITEYRRPPAEGRHVRKIPVSAEQIEILYGYVLASLYEQEIPNQNIASGYGAIRFFEAGGTYSCLYTCNNWTNVALKKAGVKTRLWTPTVWGVGP